MSFYINRAQFVKAQTEKEIDGNNFLVAYNVPIAKTGIQQYTREEIGEKLGDPDELVNVYRDREVFKDAKLVESFDGIPIVYRHPDNGKVDNNNFKEFVVGTVSGVYYENGNLYAKKLTIIDQEAISNILNKETNELSIGFRGKVVKEKGNFEGQTYHYKEEVIHANHLALCENGKAGSYYAINSKKGKNNMQNNFAMNSVYDEHEKMKDCKNAETQLQTFNIESIVEQTVRKHMAQVKPINYGNESEKPEDKKEDMVDADEDMGEDGGAMAANSDECKEDMPEKKEGKGRLVNEEDLDKIAKKMKNKSMKNKKEDEEDLENEDEGEEKIKRIEKKEKIAEKHLEKEHAAGNSTDPSLEEAEHKDKDVINALKESNKKLRNIVNNKNKEIKNLELVNINLQESLDEAKDYMTNMAKRLSQSNLMNALAGPDNEFSQEKMKNNDIEKFINTAFLFSKHSN